MRIPWVVKSASTFNSLRRMADFQSPAAFARRGVFVYRDARIRRHTLSKNDDDFSVSSKKIMDVAVWALDRWVFGFGVSLDVSGEKWRDA